MSPVVESAQGRWLAQIAAMREAVAGLDLKPESDAKPYGWDLGLTDEDFKVADADDIWDVYGESDFEESSDSQEVPDHESYQGSAAIYGKEWLRSKCTELAGRTSSGLNSDVLCNQILALLESNGQGVYLNHTQKSWNDLIDHR